MDAANGGKIGEHAAGWSLPQHNEGSSGQQQLVGLIALRAIGNVITSLTLGAGVSAPPGFLTGSWTGSVTSAGWNLKFSGQINGASLNLMETGTSSGSQNVVRWTDTGLIGESEVVTGSGEAGPLVSPVASGLTLTLTQNLSTSMSSDRSLTKSFNEPVIPPGIFILIVVVIIIIGLWLLDKNCALVPVPTKFTIFQPNKPPVNPLVAMYTTGNFLPGEVDSQDIVKQPQQIAIVHHGTLSGNGDLSVNESVQAILFDDLGLGTSAYDPYNGWTVSGGGSPGGSYIAANLFTASVSASIDHIDIGIGFSHPPPTFYASLWTDNGGLPGTELAIWNNLTTMQPSPGCCGVVSVDDISGVNLVGGQSYFLILGPVSLSDTSILSWNWNNQGVSGLDLYSQDGGATWVSEGSGATLGAFTIVGSSQASQPKH